MWAMYATPLFGPVKNCSTNQIASQMPAGISMKKKNSSVRIGARGNHTMYAPITAAIAPDAPTNGMTLLGVEHHLRDRRDDSAREVEEHEPQRAQLVLDVVAEDPEEQHVAQQVQPSAVHEHRHHGGEIDVLAREQLVGELRRMIEALPAADLDVGHRMARW